MADLDHGAGKDAAAEIDGLCIHADVTNRANREDVQRMYREAAERFGGIDLLFNNAGISPPDDNSTWTTRPGRRCRT